MSKRKRDLGVEEYDSDDDQDIVVQRPVLNRQVSDAQHVLVFSNLDSEESRSVFVNNAFEATVELRDQQGQLRTAIVPLQCELLYENMEPAPARYLETIASRSQFQIQPNGKATIFMRIKQMTTVEGRKFCIRISAVDAHHDLGPIDPAISLPVTCTQYRLQVAQHPPDVWYKDEGGREKAMSLIIQLVNAKGAHVVAPVPLRVSLVYEGNSEVKNQEILKVVNESDPVIGEPDGKAELRCRIEEVSKNHQKQRFCLKIFPDFHGAGTNPALSQYLHTAPAISAPVMVRSKRNRKKKSAPNHRGPSASAPGNTGLSVKRGQSSSSYGGVGLGQPLPSFTTQASAAPMLPGADDVMDLSSNRLKGLEAQGSFGSAVSTIITWSQYVVTDVLQQIEWQVCGYELNEQDGQLNEHRPIYRCPGCWTYKDPLRPQGHKPECTLSKALQLYDSKVLSKLQGLIALSNANHMGGAGFNEVKQNGPSHNAGDMGDLGPAGSSQAADAHINVGAGAGAGADSGLQGVDPGFLMRQQSVGPPQGFDADLDFLNAGSMSMVGGQLLSDLQNLSAPAGLGGSGISMMMSHSGFIGLAPLDEDKVEAIMTKQTQVGWPAFDSDDKVCGFYQFDDQAGHLVFVPLGPQGVQNNPAQMQELQSEFKNMEYPILTKADNVTLKNLKEQALLQHFQMQADNFVE